MSNPRLADLKDKLDGLEKEFTRATLDFVAGYGPLGIAYSEYGRWHTLWHRHEDEYAAHGIYRQRYANSRNDNPPIFAASAQIAHAIGCTDLP